VTPAPPGLKPARTIRHTRDLVRLVDELKTHALLAVDTESNSLYAYYEQVCLIQLSTRDQDYIIDPLAIDNLSPLGALLADPAIEVVFHAAEYDVMTLKRDFKFTFASIFDTMLAARICGWQAVGLGNILADQFGVRAEKRFQRANWAARPLAADQLLYAQMDTHYLPALRDRLLAELTAQDRLEEAFETFAALADLPPAEYRFDPEGYWRIHQAQDLRRDQMALVRELYLLRDSLARQRDCPPVKIFSDPVLAELARIAPRRVDDLLGIKGLSSLQVRRFGAAIVESIARGSQADPPRPPRRPTPPDPVVQARYKALHTWRKDRAAARGVESDVIVPRETLWALAHRSPTRLEELHDIPGLGPWRRATYGSDLLDVLARADTDDSS